MQHSLNVFGHKFQLSMKNQDITLSTFKKNTLVISWLSLMLAGSLCEKQPVARQTIPFENVRLNEVLNAEFLLSRYFKTTRVQCIQKCLLSPECLSVNFCESGKCELNSEDVHSENAVMEEKKLCRYLGMKVSGKMSCEEKGIQILADEIPNKSKCKSAGKQHENFWGEWRHIVEIDTIEEWKKVNKRECVVNTAHAPSTCNGTLSEVEIMEWYRFVHEFKSWTHAMLGCRELGGELFSNLNGNASQLEFLYDKLGGCGWLGGRLWSFNENL